jgi:putative colanic acid biosynthesis acetyltransferase WcaF
MDLNQSEKFNLDTRTGPSFSLKNRISRVLWNFTYTLFFRYSPKPFHSYRAFILRLFGATIGKGTHIYPKVKIWAPWNLNIGDECGIANDVELYSQGLITIGAKSVISQGTYVCTGTHDYKNPGFKLITKSIKIGNNVWVATQSFIHPGIEIGDNSVIGARSVVVKSIPENSICSGNPCLVLKKNE